VTTLGAIFPPSLPPEELRSVAVAADRAGLEQLWLWEDCFKESGIATAAAVLGWTERLTVGIGLLPVPLRNVAITAMELATIERMFPGRLVPGIGHGVLDWMGQVGVRAASPMTLLREYTIALRRLLRGDTLTTSGRYVRLDNVTLDWPPASPPPVLVGAIGQRTVALAGETSDGVIFTESTTPEALRDSLPHFQDGRTTASRTDSQDVVVFMSVDGRPSAAEVADRVGQLVTVGATHVILLSVGSAKPPLEEFVEFVARDVRPLVN
jgi:alkanesulfonate monooxygenase SsuD/methylene tetrahydromethanopterin reductase-like flavin-dependent oxidoreductase (luciferase family)